ncbi:MAG: aminotransferase class V-fold PLP-dependent enzyme [Clostridia bacterium]|nr:aminotransferase class V-fold PLP-dependent enzyme [Clostridia bacterium]
MVYFDHAATSFPKPRAVVDEMTKCMRFYCGNAGRGSHALAMAAAEKIYQCRTECADFFGSSHPENVIFTLNTTMALNTVIKGLLRPGDHVLISDMEHNAVLRPIVRLAQEGLIEYDIFSTMIHDGGRSDVRICARLARLLKRNTRMVICNHASNICSVVQPIKALGTFCRKRGILFVVDAAQSAGHLPIDMEEMQIDALCAPGHKGLLGPQGCGFFILREGILPSPLIEGGSGLHSLDTQMPQDPPERYEAGTLATPAIAGLLEGIREVGRLGIERLHEQECVKFRALRQRLLRIPSVTVYAPDYEGSVLLFNKKGMPPDEMGRALDRLGFCVRVGYHCSALGHKTLGTLSDGGGVRVSFGPYNTLQQLDALADAVEGIHP